MHRYLSATTVSSAQDIRDLRDALAFLSTLPGHLSTTSKAVDAHAELAGIYKRIGAGTPGLPLQHLTYGGYRHATKPYAAVYMVLGSLLSDDTNAWYVGSAVSAAEGVALRDGLFLLRIRIIPRNSMVPRYKARAQRAWNPGPQLKTDT